MVPPARDRRLVRAVRWAPVLIAVAIFATYVAIVRHFTADDTFITLRYSRNLARGLGAVYNPVGPRAEGYTSLLWMLLLALPHLAGVDAVLVAKAGSLVATVAAGALVGVWAFLDGGLTRARVVGAGAAVLGYAALPRTAIHAVSGMETALFTLLLTATLFAACRLARGDVEWTWPFALLGLAATLTRPEGGLAVIVSAAVAFRLVPGPARRRVVGALALGWGLPLAVVELIRLRTYGLPLPLPFYVKVTLISFAGPLPGARVVAQWLATLAPFAVPLILLFAARPRQFQPALATVPALAVFFMVPQHHMGYSSRYLAPLDPMLCVWFGVGVAMLLDGQDDALLPGLTRGPRLRAALAALSIAAVALNGMRAARHKLPERVAYARGLSAAHERLGRELAAAHLGPARIAISDAGAVPYLSDLWTLDMVGLNDSHIAVTHSRDPDWILAQSPDVLILLSADPDRLVTNDWNDYEWPLLEAATKRGFRRIARRRFADDYWLWVLTRPDGLAARLSLPDDRPDEFPARAEAPPADNP